MDDIIAIGVKIRKGKLSDIPEMTELLQDLFSIEHGFKLNVLKQSRGLSLMLEDQRDRCVLIAEQAGHVIGLCTLQVLISTVEGGPVGLLEDMIVRRGMRGMGVGKKLLLAMEDWAVWRGLTRLQLLADGTNIPALEFYKRCGWETTTMICWRKTFGGR